MRFIVFLLLVMYLICSCSEEQESIYGELVPVVFTPTLTGEVLEVSTRVVNNTWSGNETVGITSVPSGNSTLSASAKFYLYKAASSGTSSVTLNPNDNSNVIYFPVNGSYVHFYAFSPYTSPDSNNRVSYSAADQSNQSKLEAIDFIRAKDTGVNNAGFNKDNTNVTLHFIHLQSKIIVKIRPDLNVGTAAIANGGLKIDGMPTKGTYNLSDGTLHTSTDVATITPFKKAAAADSIIWEVIVPPHNGSYTNRKFSFTLNNNAYTFMIPEENNYGAGKSYTYNMLLTTYGIVVRSATITDWTGGTVSWGGNYMLRTSSDVLSFSREASITQTLTIQYQSTIEDAEPTIKSSTSATNSSAGEASWFNASLGGDKTTNGLWKQRTLIVKTTQENTNDLSRTAYIHVSLAGVTVVIAVTQGGKYDATDGLANCYMVAPEGTIKIPVARAVTHGGAAANATFTATKLWDDTADGAVASVNITGTGSNAVLTVKAGKNSGNALIAVRTGGSTGTIVWSYHIWVTDYHPWKGNTHTNTYNTNNNGKHFVFMDRNLGATKASLGSGYGTGLFYQWGRKDPFPATGGPDATQPGLGSYTTAKNTSTSLGNTIKNPSVLYIVSGGDWHSDPNVELWGHSSIKSVFDPCPVGWRVPKNSTMTDVGSPWNGFTTTKTMGAFALGYSWGTNAQYPACGKLTSTQGANSTANQEGVWWSASPNVDGDKSVVLSFDDKGKVNLSGGGSSRSNAVSIRCVQE